jgi:hypothetical protein
MKIKDCIQGQEQWLLLRRGIPTASEFKRIITPATGKFASTAAFSLACELIADAHDPDYLTRPDYVSASMANGMALEPRAIAAYEMLIGEDVQRPGFVLNDDETAGWSPDALLGEEGGAEIKVPEPKKLVAWLAEGVLPEEHKPQCHAALHIGGLRWLDFVGWNTHFPLFRVRVVPDDFTLALGKCLDKFLALKEGIERRLNLPALVDESGPVESDNPLSVMIS